MKRTIKLTSLFLVLVLITAACSKEKRIERSLHSRSGKWLIAEEKHEIYINGSLQSSSTEANAGNIVFDKDGTLVFTNVNGSTTESLTGTWSNTEDKLTLIVDGESAVYTIEDHDKKEMTITLDNSYTFNGDTYRDYYETELKKDN